ncbi:unnamed protein product [Acanthoscelides obtectus]|uniref:Uncharacterized protein n=1 Tax=Acanthoscelides obtectus TaxID=200917 RepID=A0A9P0LGW3_ACAOB|nr:unnamed protein product [Acanthoscelides obtectus]CAK1683352.1 hypothetical protein AOBTE_LOCUS34213 [Acanthoscelides obtectus]
MRKCKGKGQESSRCRDSEGIIRLLQIERMRKCKEKGLGVVDACRAVRELFVCYKCNYVANCTADLMSHLNEDNANLSKVPI